MHYYLNKQAMTSRKCYERSLKNNNCDKRDIIIANNYLCVSLKPSLINFVTKHLKLSGVI